MNAYAQAHAENFLTGYSPYWHEVEVSQNASSAHGVIWFREGQLESEKSSPDQDRGCLFVED